MHQQSGWTATPSRLIGAPTSAIPTIFTQDVFHSTTLPIYPGLGQASNMLACIPSGLVNISTFTELINTVVNNIATFLYVFCQTAWLMTVLLNHSGTDYFSFTAVQCGCTPHLALLHNVVRIASWETRTFKDIHHIRFPKQAENSTHYKTGRKISAAWNAWVNHSLEVISQ